jgi:ATPase subunit of ABC transporter with duplicated ATPase domains
VLWLEHYLTTSFRGTLLVVSHDRHFLNAVVTDVAAFDQQQKSLKVYKGDVTNFEAVRADEKLRQKRLWEVQEARRQHMQKFIDDHAKAGENGPKAAAQRKSRMKKMERLGVEAAGGDGRRYKASYDTPAEEVEKVVEEAPVELDFPDPGAFDKPVVTMEGVSFAYEIQQQPQSPQSPQSQQKTAAAAAAAGNEDEDDEDEFLDEDYRPAAAAAGGGGGAHPPPPPQGASSSSSSSLSSPPEPPPCLLRDVELQIDCKSRVALLGRNGCGKSTLIKLMVGALRPNRGGQVRLNGNAKVEYVAQHQLEQLDPLSTPLQTMLGRYPGNGGDAHAQKLRQHLARFGLGGELLPHQKILTLSGGQK